LSTVEACGWRRKKPKVMDFVLHIENVDTVMDNVVWYTDTGESGTGTPPEPPTEGTMKRVARGYQFVLLGEGTYLQLDDTQIPIAPEDYKCNYAVITTYDVEYPVLFELEYFVRERITFNSAGFKGWLSIYSYETGYGIYNPDSPVGVDLEVSGTCCGYGMINGRFVTLKGERHLTLPPPTMFVEDFGTIRFFNW
jgi:hypothetical protein